MATQVNLQELLIERPSLSREGRSVVQPRNVMTRFILPLALLGGFVAVIGFSLGSSYWPTVPVTIITVIASRAEVSAADTPLFQAAGWVEPRPQPVIITALVEGIVDEMLVVEGQSVEPGQVV
ncbi:MAG TPA: hemolysin D, partial [Schlesneria sp.]